MPGFLSLILNEQTSQASMLCKQIHSNKYTHFQIQYNVLIYFMGLNITALRLLYSQQKLAKIKITPSESV